MGDIIIVLIDGVKREDWYAVDGKVLSSKAMVEYLDIELQLSNIEAWDYLAELTIEERFWREEVPFIDSEKWKKKVLNEYRKK